jgi:hypothetical protein
MPKTKVATFPFDSEYEDKVDQVEDGGMIFLADVGDPVAHPDIEDFIRYCSLRRIRVSIPTTGQYFHNAPMIALYNETIASCIISLDNNDEDDIETFIARFKTTRGAHKYPTLGVRTHIDRENSSAFISILRYWLLPGKVDIVVRTVERGSDYSMPDDIGFKGIETLRSGPDVKIYTHSDYCQKFYSLVQEWSGLSWDYDKHARYNAEANLAEPGFAEF